jgi:multiple sugar transport system substrate-binding protein
MKKHVIGIAGIGAALLLAGQAAAQDRIVIAGRDGVYAEGLRMMVEAYQEANPGVEIELLELPYANLYERAVISMREGSGAYDVVLMDDTWATEFMSQGWLADLDELGGGADADFIDRTLAVSRYPYGDGTLHAIPMVGNVELFAYRADLFEEAGLEAPPADWDAVVAAAAALDGVVEHGVVYRGQKANPIVTGFLPILWAHGARLVDEQGEAALDTPAAVDALELYLSLRPYAPEDVVVWNSSEVRDALQSGRAAMSIEVWPSWIPSLDDLEVSEVVGTMEIIAAPGQVEGPAPMIGAWLLAVPADAPNPEGGRDFIDFVTGAENQERLALEVGLPPTRASVYTDEDVVAQYRWYPAQLEALRNAQPRPRIVDWSRVESIMGDYLQLALLEEMTPEEAIAEAHAEIAAALAE